jgi:hypothetical protein
VKPVFDKEVGPRHALWLVFGFWKGTPKAQPKMEIGSSHGIFML